jgi:hypothetical protein
MLNGCQPKAYESSLINYSKYYLSYYNIIIYI